MRALVAGGTFVLLLAVWAVADTHVPLTRDVGATSAPPAAAASMDEAGQGFLYGRITTENGATYEGRLRFGGAEEAFWTDYFNGSKKGNPWAAHAPIAPAPIQIFGFALPFWHEGPNLARQLMVRFGDITRIEARGRNLRVTIKSGTMFHLDRFGADDFADGLRVWDGRHGVIELDEWRIRSIDFLPTARLDGTPGRLHGTVRTAHGDFTGFIQWDREQCVDTDELVGRAGGTEVRLRFDAIRTIARRSQASALITLRDGREITLAGSRHVGDGHRGIYVDDRRYGRVLVSWDAFERVEFSAGGSGPAYSDFAPGRPLSGSVVTRGGRRLSGRLVYDLDETETTETLDAPRGGVDYTIPFGAIASIAPVDRAARDAGARVTLHTGEVLHLDRAGDLDAANAGVLIFVDGRERPDYVPWADVEQIDLTRVR